VLTNVEKAPRSVGQLDDPDRLAELESAQNLQDPNFRAVGQNNLEIISAQSYPTPLLAER